MRCQPRELHSAAEVFANCRDVRSRLLALHRPDPPPPVIVVVPEPVVLEAIEPEIKWRTATRHRIRSIVASHYGLTLAEIQGESRRKIYIKPRHIAMFLCVKLAGMSMKATGEFLGGRDHTTVLSGVRKIEVMCAGDPAIAAEVAALACTIEEAP